MSAPRPWEPRDGGLRLRLRVTPRARHPGIEGMTPDADGRPFLVVKVAAPPAEGAANAAVVALIAKALGLPRSAVTIGSGASARVKTLHVDGPQDTLARRLEDLVSS